MSEANRKVAVILLVEDDAEDQRLTVRAFEASKLHNELHVVGNGEDALDYLFRTGQYENPRSSPRPDLILLDLNMPRIDGRDVLKKIKEDPDLRRIAVVILTTSSHEEDILRSYDLGVNSYITKPIKMSSFMDAIHDLQHYWFELVVLPDE